MINIKLKALERIESFTKKKIMVLDDWGPFDDGFEEISLSKGSEDEAHLWLAETLENKNVARILDVVTLDELGKILFQERQTVSTPASLVKLPKDFYQRVKILRNNLKNSRDLSALDQLRKVDQFINEIVSIRIRKIIQLAFLGINDQNVLDRMTGEEILVFKMVKYVIEKGIGELFGNSAS
ncbi:MAG: hypothetical protein RXR59_06280 [Sulfolobus sp.]|jgi:DNA replication factor GINS|nr:hypothetical protein [Sulfolobaceae archaeon]